MTVMSLAALAFTDQQIAATMYIGERQVRRHWEEAAARVFEGTSILPTRDGLIAWWWAQSSCCMAGALNTIMAGRLSAEA